MEKPNGDATVQRDGAAGGGEENENDEASAQDEMQVVGEKARLRRRKTASKGVMTKRISRVQEIIAANGSRTKVKYFRLALLDQHEEQKEIGKEIANFAETEEELTWLETERDRLNEIVGEIDDYLNSRLEEVSSRSSEISAWLRQSDAKVRLNGRLDISEQEEYNRQRDEDIMQDAKHAESRRVAEVIDKPYVKGIYQDGLRGHENGQDLFNVQTRDVNRDDSDVIQHKTLPVSGNRFNTYVSDFREREPLASEHGGGAFMKRLMLG